MKILMVDDDPSLVQIATSALTQKGHSVVTISEGQKVLEVVRLEKPEFILLDQILPDILGLDVLQALKSDSETKSIPVAIYSAYSNTEGKEQALKLGAVGFLLKYEIASDHLADKIEELLHPAPEQSPPTI